MKPTKNLNPKNSGNIQNKSINTDSTLTYKQILSRHNILKRQSRIQGKMS